MPRYTLHWSEINKFKSKWPAHGLPDRLDSLSFEFAINGDLVDLEAYDCNGTALDTHDFDGSALSALAEDAYNSGDQS